MTDQEIYDRYIAGTPGSELARELKITVFQIWDILHTEQEKRKQQEGRKQIMIGFLEEI